MVGVTITLENKTNPVITLYYREGCHLCEQVAVSLYEKQKTFGYEIESIDIDNDAELKKRYDVDVPVVAFNGEVLFYHFFDEESLRECFSSQ